MMASAGEDNAFSLVFPTTKKLTPLRIASAQSRHKK